VNLSSIEIRKMAEADLEKALKIEQACFSDPWSENAFRSDLNNELASLIVAEFEKTIVGFSNLYIVAGEIQIGNFAVAAGFRNRGVGKKLMERIFETARENNCGQLLLEVRKSNKPAVDLYKSYGFVETGTRKDYYNNPKESAILMTMEL
jgi:ribosomal-protein-alanine N-acetyltransferase